MKKPKIGLDVDDVLAAFYVAYALRHNKPLHPVDIWGEQWIFDKFKNNTLEEKFWSNLPVYTPPESINFEVDCYISNIDPKFHKSRMDWLINNGFPDAQLYLTSDKLSVIKERDLDYFIDDKYETIKLIQDSECKCIPIQFLPWYHTPSNLGIYNACDMETVNNFIFNA